jgi:hypothetical protein
MKKTGKITWTKPIARPLAGEAWHKKKGNTAENISLNAPV